MQPGTPYGDVSHIINQETDVRLVSGGKLKYVIRRIKPCGCKADIEFSATKHHLLV